MLEIKSTIISEMEKIQPRCYLTISKMSIYTKHTEIDKTLCWKKQLGGEKFEWACDPA